MKGGHSQLRDMAWLVNSWWALAKTLIMNVWRKRISCAFHLQHCWILQGYLYQTKAKVMCVYFLRIELVVKLVFEVKSAVDFFSAYIYDYHFGPSSPITQNLACKNDLLARSVVETTPHRNTVPSSLIKCKYLSSTNEQHVPVNVQLSINSQCHT